MTPAYGGRVPWCRLSLVSPMGDLVIQHKGNRREEGVASKHLPRVWDLRWSFSCTLDTEPVTVYRLPWSDIPTANYLCLSKNPHSTTPVFLNELWLTNEFGNLWLLLLSPRTVNCYCGDAISCMRTLYVRSVNGSINIEHGSILHWISIPRLVPSQTF